MEIREDYQRKAAEKATLLELIDRYKSMGFEVHENYPIGDFRCDLYVEKDDIKLAFEVKTRELINHSRRQMELMRKYVEEQGVHFRVVIAPRPVQRQIVVEDVEQIILNAFLCNLPDDLDALSTHTIPQEVEEVSITKISISKGGVIRITGSSEVVVDFEYDNKDDEELMFTESVPFRFSCVLVFDDNGNLSLLKFTELEFDTSSFEQ